VRVVRDLEPGKARSLKQIVRALGLSGFQATQLGRAAEVMGEVFSDRECVTFLSFTANLVASGLRGAIAETIRRGLVDVVVTTGGAVDHDFMKSFEPYFLGSFDADDRELHERGINRLGNVFIPTGRYELLEKKIKPVLERVCEENAITTPRKLGLQLHFFNQDHHGFVLDELGDLKERSAIVLSAKRTGAIVLGGGPAKHFTLGANILRGGLDKAVYVTTASEWDGSLSGAETREAKSWGKIKENAGEVTVHGDATILYPLLLAALV